MLAESWQFLADAKQLQFNLRTGVKWHDGRDFTSADVKWSLERIGDPKVAGGHWLRFAKWFPSIETPDDRTVVLHLDAPRPTALDVTHDATALVVRLEASGVDAISDPPLSDLARLKNDPKYTVVLTRPGYYTLGVNTQPPGTTPMLNDKRFRQALNLAIDRQHFAQSVLLGLSEPWNLPWPSYSEAYEPAKQSVTTFDLDKARGLLEQAGLTQAEVDIIYRSTDRELAKWVQIYQADLAKIGITLNIRPLEAAAFTNATSTRQYQLQANSSAAAQYHPNTVFYFDAGIGRYFGGVEQATVDAVSSGLDAGKRKQLYSQMNDFILDQSLDMVFGQTQRALVYPTRVHDLTRAVNQVTGYTNAFISG